MREQEQFLDVVDRGAAERRWREAIRPRVLPAEWVALPEALGRILAEDVIAVVDVPAFDRSNLDGYAVRSEDTFGASEGAPVRLRLNDEELATGVVPQCEVSPGTATPIATGGMLPRGADAVLMVELTSLERFAARHSVETPSPAGCLSPSPPVGEGWGEREAALGADGARAPDRPAPPLPDPPPQEGRGAEGRSRRDIVRATVSVFKPVAPGAGVTFAGTDIARGELVLRRGRRLSSRETGVLAAIGRDRVEVVRRPRVAIVSTGDELIAPGEEPRPGSVYDSNSTVLADAVGELGAEPFRLGIVSDEPAALEAALDRALEIADVVLLSGGTSKGAGDLSFRALAGRRPGIVVHGVALKPGKPLCLGAVGAVPVAVLPGFPTSAIFTFHEFVAPLIRELAGAGCEDRESIAARLAVRVNSERGRTEYLLVHLVAGHEGLTAYPMGKGSGSVTAFGRADGFVTIPRQQEYVEAGEAVSVVALGKGTRPADLTVVGSHCTGLDLLLGLLGEAGFTSKAIWVGSQGGLVAAGRGECDVAGVHLLDPESGRYNEPFLPEGVRLQAGYARMQGIVFRPGDRRFDGRAAAEAVAAACGDAGCAMVNRNRGSGTRVVIDGLLAGRKPPGHAIEARSHNAVAAAVAGGRADWGIAIASVAAAYGLGFLPVAEERYDFAIPADRWGRPPVSAFRALLGRADVRRRLEAKGFRSGEARP